MKSLFLAYNKLSFPSKMFAPAVVCGGILTIAAAFIYWKINSIIGEYSQFNGDPATLIPQLQDRVSDLVTSVAAITGILLLLVGLFIRKVVYSLLKMLNKIDVVLQNVARGVFSERITKIRTDDELGRIAWLLKESFDQIEAFLKEVTTFIHYSSQKKYFRKPRLEGTKGLIRMASEKTAESLINLEFMNEKLNKERETFARLNSILIDAVTRLSSGELTIKIQGEGDEQVQKLYRQFNESVSQFRNLLLTLREQTNKTVQIGSIISSNSDTIASRAHEQKVQINEIATAIGEVTRTIHDISQNAMTAYDAANQSGRLAEEGGKIIHETLQTMESIVGVVNHAVKIVEDLGKSTSEIGMITQVIGDIAEQTNLLALNAAIEAARAGEQGRGFAVVADEVRKLAERTAASTKQINVMVNTVTSGAADAIVSIKQNSAKVSEGSELASRAGKSLETIIKGSVKVADMVNQVAAASEELASSAEEINRNVENISEFFKQNSDEFNDIAASAEHLNAVITELQKTSSKFIVDEKLSNKKFDHAIVEDSINLGINAHKLWKSKIHQILSGELTMANSAVLNHTECQLGKTYYSTWRDIFSGQPTYEQLGEKHKQMHDAVKRTVELYNAGKKTEAAQISRSVLSLSDEVVALLEKMKDEVLELEHS